MSNNFTIIQRHENKTHYMCTMYYKNDCVHALWTSSPKEKITTNLEGTLSRVCTVLQSTVRAMSPGKYPVKLLACTYTHTNTQAHIHAQTLSGLSAISWTLGRGLLRNTLFTEGSDQKNSVEFCRSSRGLRHILEDKSKQCKRCGSNA